MKKIKYIIIFLLILLIIISCVLYISKKEKDDLQIGADIPEYELVKNFTQISNSSEYYNVKYCIELYYANLSDLNKRDLYIDYYGYSEEEFKQQVKDELQRLYYMLGKEYIDAFNITNENILEHYSQYKGEKFYINCIYKCEISQSVNAFIVYGKQVNYETSECSDYGFLLKLDRENLTFEIYPYEYMKYKNYLSIKENDLIDFEVEDKIESNDYNTYIYQVASEEEIAKELFSNYRNNLIYDIENAYNLLNKDYRDVKFGNIQNFKEYIDNNIEKIYRMYVTNYKKYNDSEHTQYTCLDNNNDSYIFDINSMTNYNVFLDVYTIDLPQFIEQYDSSNEQEKVLLNIEKIKQALNSGDYSYVYSKLADSFKNNKYKTQEEFENYIKNTLYNNIDIEYKTFSNEGQTYIYNITIKNLTNESDESINMQVIMQLKDNRDFVMSFSIK